MMKNSLIIAVFLTVFFEPSTNCREFFLSDLISISYQQTKKDALYFIQTTRFDKKCSIGLEYRLDDQSKNPWGDLSININCCISNNKTSGHAAFRLNYENKYGLLGSCGHLQGKVEAHHPNKAIDLCTQIVLSDLNTVIDYNPDTIAHNTRVIAQKKQLLQKNDDTYLEKQARSLAAKKTAEDFEHSINKQIFLSHKAAFESRPFDENNPRDIRMKRMLQELEEIYGSE